MNKNRIIISNSVEYHSIDINRILYIQSDGNYCTIHLTSGVILDLLPVRLWQLAQQLHDLTEENSHVHYIQVGRSTIINLEHVESIYNSRRLIVFDETEPGTTTRLSLSLSQSLISKLRELLTGHEQESLNPPLSNIKKESDFEYDDETVVYL